MLLAYKANADITEFNNGLLPVKSDIVLCLRAKSIFDQFKAVGMQSAD